MASAAPQSPPALRGRQITDALHRAHVDHEK